MEDQQEGGDGYERHSAEDEISDACVTGCARCPCVMVWKKEKLVRLFPDSSDLCKIQNRYRRYGAQVGAAADGCLFSFYILK